MLTVGTTEPRPSEGPLGERGRHRGDGPGRRAPLRSYLRPDRKVVWVEDPGAAKTACQLRTTSRCLRAGQRAHCAVVPWGMPPLRGARFQPDWGKPNVRMIGGQVETCRSGVPAQTGLNARPRAFPRQAAGVHRRRATWLPGGDFVVPKEGPPRWRRTVSALAVIVSGGI